MLAFGAQLADLCERIWPNLDVRMLRSEDTDLSVDQAAQLALKAHCQFNVCLHVNAYTDGALHGVSTFAMPNDDLGHRVGNVVLDTYPERLAPMRRRTWHADPYEDGHGWLSRPRNVLHPFTLRGMSAVLVELFYASSPSDRTAVGCNIVRTRMQLAIACGIAHWVGRHRR